VSSDVTGTAAGIEIGEAELLTIDQLAGRCGVSVRTIRFYAGRGLLPPPRLRGRLGLYGPDHLARLELISELSLAELDRRSGRSLTSDELDILEVLGVIERRSESDSVLLHGTASLSAALQSLESGLPVDALRRSHELIAKHTAALAEELMQLFQDEVLQPYRDRGRPAAERARLREAFTRLKPITVQGVVAAFGRAVNRTIRDRLAGEEPRPDRPA
jgi:DNA-binding transcriptional MerR regulator